MSIVNNNPGFRFPVAHPYDSDTVPSLPIIPMPQPQPFQHGTVVFGQPGGYPSPPGGGFWDQRQEPYYPPQHLDGGPPEDFDPQPQGQTSPPALFPLPLSIGLEIEPRVLHLSAPYRGPSEAQQPPQPVKIQLGADDIKPNVYHFSHLADAVRELGTCKTIFEQCDDKLVNDLMLVFRKESSEFKIQIKAEELKGASSVAVDLAQDIYIAHQDFAQMIVYKLRVISQSNGVGSLFPDEVLNARWGKIQELSLSITTTTDALQKSIYDLNLLIAQTKDKYERQHLRKKLWEWLVHFFEAIARALGGVHHGIMAGLGRAGLVGAAVGANGRSLTAAARAICSDIEKFKTKQEQGFQPVLEFLNKELPESIKTAQLSLTNCNAFRKLQQADLMDRRDNLSGEMTAEEARKSLRDWETLCRPRT